MSLTVMAFLFGACVSFCITAVYVSWFYRSAVDQLNKHIGEQKELIDKMLVTIKELAP